ncbi:MAG: hypothetical protein JWM71_852 [Solirubrobacteraceae bacterium]|nr:hypothetical protein [Solirubrobacteraceae bacterium]
MKNLGDELLANEMSLTIDRSRRTLDVGSSLPDKTT